MLLHNSLLKISYFVRKYVRFVFLVIKFFFLEKKMSVFEKINILCENDNLTEEFLIFFRSKIIINHAVTIIVLMEYFVGVLDAVLLSVLLLYSFKKDISYEQRKSFFVITCLQDTDVS